MPRTTTPAYDAAIAAVVTSPTHLVEVGFSPTPARWSDAGPFTFTDGRQFTALDMKLGALRFSMETPQGGLSMRLGNLDNAVGALFLNAIPAELPVTIWAADAKANAPLDAPLLGVFTIQGVKLGPEFVELALTPAYLSAPFRRVDAAYGFNHATPAGTRVVWGSEVFIVEAE